MSAPVVTKMVSTSDGAELAGRRLEPGNRIEILIKYDNQALRW